MIIFAHDAFASSTRGTMKPLLRRVPGVVPLYRTLRKRSVTPALSPLFLDAHPGPFEDEFATTDNTRDLYVDVFGRDISQDANWLHLPVPFGSPEAMEILHAVWRLDRRIWLGFLHTLASESIAGDVVEFGVASGKSLKFLVENGRNLGLDARYWGFDSFEGLAEPSEYDYQFWHKGAYSYSLESVAKVLDAGAANDLILVKGWFSETLPKTDVPRIAFARIDPDHYEPTLEVLNYLTDRLVDGAFVTFDDWTHDKNVGETRAFFEWYPSVRGRLQFHHVASIAHSICHFRVRRLN
jgi:hypothetical protein